MPHLHSVYDSDTHFKIDSVTRQIINESGKVILMQNDHNSERFTFDIPRYIDGHDMSLCNMVEVHYINTKSDKTEKQASIYAIEDLQVSPAAEDVVICSWLISQNATKHAGSLNFLLKFKCVEDGVVNYVWNTAIHSDVSVSSGIDNGEVIVERYPDILEQLLQKVLGIGSTIGEVELLAVNWEGEQSPYSQIVSVEGITKRSQVDLTPSVEQLAIFHEKDLAFVTENEDGVVTVFAIGQKPTNDYTIQVTITEVKA